MQFDKEVSDSLWKTFDNNYIHQHFPQSIIRVIILMFAEILQRQTNFMERLILSLTNLFESKYFLLPAILILPVIPKHLAICDLKLCPSLIFPFLLLQKNKNQQKLMTFFNPHREIRERGIYGCYWQLPWL